MIKLPLFARHRHEDGVEYHVKAEGFKGGEYDLSFDKRDKARVYKKSLKESKSQLQAVIIRREYLGNYILEEKEVY